MKKFQKGFASSLALVFVLVVVAVCGYSFISAKNYGVEAENGIKRMYENNENILASYSQKVLEVSQVPAMARDDLVKLVNEAIKARYGEQGSKAVFQIIKEQNPNIDPALYTKITQLIEAGRDEFKQAQTKFVDEKRSYENNLGYAWRGMWLGLAGYPRINLADYKIISSDYAASAFKSGKEKGPIQLRSN